MTSIQDIIEYATHTPHNTNPAVLASMLQSFEDSTGRIVISPDEPTDIKAVVWFKTTLDASENPVSFEILLKVEDVWKAIPITNNNSLYVNSVAPASQDVEYWLDTSDNENGGEE